MCLYFILGAVLFFFGSGIRIIEVWIIKVVLYVHDCVNNNICLGFSHKTKAVPSYGAGDPNIQECPSSQICLPCPQKPLATTPGIIIGGNLQVKACSVLKVAPQTHSLDRLAGVQL